jgi:hypothetical protein
MLNLFGWYRLYKWAKETDDNDKVHELFAVAMALGLIGVFLFAFLVVHDDPANAAATAAAASSARHERDLIHAFAWAAAAFSLPGFGLIVYRLVRPLQGRAAIPSGCCTFCKRQAATTPIRFVSVTGALVWFFISERAGFACRRCTWQHFLVTTVTTGVLGWWSLFSLFVTPGVVIHNVLLAARALVVGSRPSAYAQRQAFLILDERRDYARAIVASKDPEDAVEVLAETSGVPALFVAAYIDELQRPRPVGPIP